MVGYEGKNLERKRLFGGAFSISMERSKASGTDTQPDSFTGNFTRKVGIPNKQFSENLKFFVGDNIEQGKLQAANVEKADELLRSTGKSYPKENTFISFN